MSTQLQSRLLSADELLALPDDGYRYELVKGELKKASPPGEQHSILVVRLTLSLGAHVEANRLGQVYAGEPGIKLSSNPDTVRAPDVAFVRQERLEALPPGTGHREEAPDLVVEVVSPSDLYTDVDEEVAQWLEAGVRVVLVVNPRNRSVSVYRSPYEMKRVTGRDVIDGEDVVPGWQLGLEQLFA